MQTTVSDKQIVDAVDAAITKFRSAALEYKDGKDALLGIFTDEVMKKLPDADSNIVEAFARRRLDRVTVFQKSTSEKQMLKDMKRQFKQSR